MKCVFLFIIALTQFVPLGHAERYVNRWPTRVMTIHADRGNEPVDLILQGVYISNCRELEIAGNGIVMWLELNNKHYRRLVYPVESDGGKKLTLTIESQLKIRRCNFYLERFSYAWVAKGEKPKFVPYNSGNWVYIDRYAPPKQIQPMRCQFTIIEPDGAATDYMRCKDPVSIDARGEAYLEFRPVGGYSESLDTVTVNHLSTVAADNLFLRGFYHSACTEPYLVYNGVTRYRPKKIIIVDPVTPGDPQLELKTRLAKDGCSYVLTVADMGVSLIENNVDEMEKTSVRKTSYLSEVRDYYEPQPQTLYCGSSQSEFPNILDCDSSGIHIGDSGTANVLIKH